MRSETQPLRERSVTGTEADFKIVLIQSLYDPCLCDSHTQTGRARPPLQNQALYTSYVQYRIIYQPGLLANKRMMIE